MGTPDELVEAFSAAVPFALRELAGVEAVIREVVPATAAGKRAELAAVVRLALAGGEAQLIFSFPQHTAEELARRILTGLMRAAPLIGATWRQALRGPGAPAPWAPERLSRAQESSVMSPAVSTKTPLNSSGSGLPVWKASTTARAAQARPRPPPIRPPTRVAGLAPTRVPRAAPTTAPTRPPTKARLCQREKKPVGSGPGTGAGAGVLMAWELEELPEEQGRSRREGGPGHRHCAPCRP